MESFSCGSVLLRRISRVEPIHPMRANSVEGKTRSDYTGKQNQTPEYSPFKN